MKIVAVDPGVRLLGIAYGELGGALEWATFVRSPEQGARGGRAATSMAWAVAEALRGREWAASVIEWPEQYDGAGNYADRADITLLTAVAGGVGTILASRDLAWELTPQPKEWKGQVPKDVHNARVMERVTAAERARIVWPAKSLAHNVIDALGLFYWAGGEIARLERQAAR